MNFNERLPRVKEHFRVELLTGRRKESILVQMRTRKVVPIEQRIRGILRSPEGRRITLWSISLLTVFGILFVMEFACAMYLATLAPADSVGKFRRSRPPPYQNAPYFSSSFVHESFLQPHYKDLNELIPDDFAGRYFNVRDGRRVTAFQPPSHANKVLLFGGSTIYCQEVPDEWTVASLLQARLTNIYGNRFLVENYGATSANIQQQLRRLRTVKVSPGDIVVFYDGVNDVYRILFYGRLDQTLAQTIDQLYSQMSWIQKIKFTLSEKTSIGRVFFDPFDRERPRHFANPVILGKLLDNLKQQYQQALLEAHDYVEKSGATFVHFLQPHLYARENRSAYERKLEKNHYLVYAGSEETFKYGYPKLREAMRATTPPVRNYDFSNILNDRPPGVEYFLDAYHVNHEANQVIADKILDVLREIIASRDVSGQTPMSNSKP